MHPYYYFRNGQNDVIGLFDGNGNIVARYSYDSWGNLLKITDSSGNDKTNDTTFVGYKNPLRYRGYYYDSETKLYYLQSRYYNPEWGRFLNADGIIGANGDLTSNNLFAYCSNNPVMFMDPSGHIAETAAGVLLYLLYQAAKAVFAAAVATTAAAVAVVAGAETGKAISNSKAEADAKPAIQEKVKEQQEKGTKIYRSASGTYMSLTPRPGIDDDFRSAKCGLSFYLKPPTDGKKYVVTTIEAVNATGVLMAVQNGPNHVSVVPTVCTPNILKEWSATRPTADINPHPYTRILRAICLGPFK